MSGSAVPRMAFVDTMRLLAATLVLVQHLFEGSTGFARDWIIPLAPGVAGVAIFFFISGYVIPLAARNGLDALAFLIRRLFRIYPLYLVAVALIVLGGATGLMPRLASMAASPPDIWVANFFLIAEYVGVRPFLGVSWTLAIELIWYALFAVSIIMFGKRAADRLDVIVPASFMALALISLMIDVRIPLGRPTMIYAAVVGFQCFRFHTGEIDRRQLTRSILVFAGVATFGTYVAFGVFSHPNLTLGQAIGPWIVATCVFLAGVLYGPLRDAAVLNTGLLPALGAMSYSTYLLHPLATEIAHAHVVVAAQIPFAVGLTFVMSWLGFTFIEKPGIRAGRAVADYLTSPARRARSA